MLVSLKWLDTMVKVPDGLQDFCDRLDLTGTGVEGVSKVGASLEGVKIGYVLDVRAASRQRPYARHDRRLWRRRGAHADRLRCPQHRGRPEGRRRHGWHGAARRRQDQEIQASRRQEQRHDLLGTRAGHWRRPHGHHGAARRRAARGRVRRVEGPHGHGARPRDYAEPPRLPVHEGLRARGGRDVPHPVEL